MPKRRQPKRLIRPPTDVRVPLVQGELQLPLFPAEDHELSDRKCSETHFKEIEKDLVEGSVTTTVMTAMSVVASVGGGSG